LANWTPPENYLEVDSQIEGISVYAPRPEIVARSDKPTTYTCPKCGASTKFNVSAGGIACEHCGYTSKPDSITVGRSAEELEFTLDTLKAEKWLKEQNRRDLTCEQCGAVISIPAQSLTVTCPFCASNRVALHESIGHDIKPKFLIPFKIQPKEVQVLAKEWLGKGWYHPEELSQQARINQFAGIYLPFWTFDANITSNWRAEVGYEKQERYYDSSSKSWKTRTRIDWRWESGQVHVRIDDLLVKGTAKVSKIILERINAFDMHDLQEFDPDFLAGWNAQHFDVQLSIAWEEGKALMRETAKEKCYQDIPSRHVRNFSAVADFSDEVWRYILLPVYISAYKFKDETFQIMINGQNGTIAGQKPVEWWKVWIAIAGMLIPGLGLGLIGLPLLLLNGLGVFPIVLGGILLAVGGVFAFRLYKQATDSEAA